MYIKEKEYRGIVKEILRNTTFKQMYNIEHHGISRWEHLIKISYHSYKIAKKLRMDYVSVARGALLHDFYLDGDERCAKRKFLDTFVHPKKALETSNNFFSINEIEKNIIVSHMFPIYPFALPTYKESILVDAVDKVIGTYELLRECRYRFKYRFNFLFIFILLMVNVK